MYGVQILRPPLATSIALWVLTHHSKGKYMLSLAWNRVATLEPEAYSYRADYADQSFLLSTKNTDIDHTSSYTSISYMPKVTKEELQ
jgi:hypothetical protein